MLGKSRVESALMPFASRIPINPNALTLFAVLIMAAAAWEVTRGEWEIAAVLVFLSGFIDVLDGTVAKSQKKATPFGAFVDRVGDRVADALIFSAIILAGVVQLWLGLVVLVLVLVGSYASACLEAATKTKIGEKLSMRAVRLLLLALALVSMPMSPAALECAFYIIGLLALVALAQRFCAARKVLSRRSTQL